MTYCIGFRYRDSVYLIGDAAVTNATPAYHSSTFGELHTFVRARRVEEAVIKIARIAPSAMVAIAGNVDLAVEIVDFMRVHYRDAVSPNELFEKVAAEFTPFSAGVEILLGTAPAKGPTTLTKWTTDKGIEREPSDYREIGGLPGHLRQLTFEMCKHVVAQNTDAAAILSVMTAQMQSLGVHDNLIEQGVGGIFFGMRAVAGTTTWQWDTAYIIYNSAWNGLTFLKATALGDILTVWSSVFAGARHLMFPSNTRTEQEFWSNVPQTIDLNLWSHCTCLRTDDRRITSIFRPDPRTHPSRFIKFHSKDTPDGVVLVGVEPATELLAHLLRPLETSNDPRTVNIGLQLIIDHPAAPDLMVGHNLPPAVWDILKSSPSGAPGPEARS